MSMREYHTFTYIMYKENLEREKREAEEAAKRADAEKKSQQREEEQRKQQEQESRPKTRAEILLEAKRNAGLVPVKKELSTQPQSQESNVEYDPRFAPPSIMDEFVDYIEDEI